MIVHLLSYFRIMSLSLNFYRKYEKFYYFDTNSIFYCELTPYIYLSVGKGTQLLYCICSPLRCFQNTAYKKDSFSDSMIYTIYTLSTCASEYTY